MLKVRSIARLTMVIVGGLALTILVLAVTMDRIYARSAPSVALKWNPGSADANARAGELLLEHMKDDLQDELDDYGRRSLARQPVNATAATLLGIGEGLKGHDQRARRLVQYAETMSRREVPTELWLIEDNVQRNDIKGALVHYDHALRTSDRTRDALFPVLNQAVADPAIAAPTAVLLARHPVWGRPFMTQYIAVSTSPDTLYTFARALQLDQSPPVDPTMLQAIEKRLVDLFAYSQSAALYNQAHGLAANNRAPLRNGGFEQPGGWDPFDWNLIDEENLAGLRQPSPVPNGGTALFPFAANGRGGDVAVQLTLLPPGRYTIAARIGGTSGDPLAFPQLVVRCARDGREFLHSPFPSAPEAGRPWHVAFTVPVDCGAQRIVVRAASAFDMPNASPWIDNVVIRASGVR